MFRHKGIALGLTSALAITGCTGGEGRTSKVETLPLIVQAETYAYDPAKAGPKGSGDLGQSSRALTVGEHVLASCLYHDPHDVPGLSDAIKLADTDLVGQLVPLEVFDSGSTTPIPVFNVSSQQIRDKLNLC